jgi:hexosaminidase
VDYAASRFVTVVPEIEMPAHALAALASYPEFSCTGGPFYVMPGGYWPISDIYCAGNDFTFTFIENVLSEVIDLFPGAYIHVGGDEAAKDKWKTCPKCQARIRAESLKDEAELQSYFIKRIEKFLISKNKRLVGWDEILEGGLAPEATVMSWRGEDGGIAAAKANHDVVMAPNSHTYFDYYQADPKSEPLAIGGLLPLEKVYSYNPTPAVLTAEQAGHILGVQAQIWTEYIPYPNNVEYMAFPRACALSEVAWTPVEAKDYKDFLARLRVHLNRLDAAGVRYRPLGN